MSAENWDPLPAQREFYRHRLTGDLGWLVRREGREHIRYDRGPAFELTIAVRRDDKGAVIDWNQEKAPAPLNDYHLGMIAWQADCELQRHLGEIGRIKQWRDLRQEDRVKWIQEGPQDGSPMRREVYQAIKSALEPFTK